MPLSWNEIRSRSVAFVREWADESSENAEAKSFWDDFFNVFGVPRHRVATFERHIKKASGHDGYIDLFWPKVMLVEHKSRGANLDSAYIQATDYFPGLSDTELPRYIVVSDFARIRLRNLDTDKAYEFPLSELPDKLQLFGFMAGYETRRYKDQDPVNIKAAKKLADLHDALADIGYTGHQLEIYLVRILFCLFADNTGIFLPKNLFEDVIRTRTAEDGSDLAGRINQVFQVLNTPPEERLKNLDEQVAQFPYINGRLFEEWLPQASFDSKMRDTLLACCELDWGAISPAIFGSLFQGIMDPEERRALGAHYTSEKNIQKVIGPLFMDELWDEFEKVKTQKGKLLAFHDKIASLNFFDPACGCGNFLVVSYRELRLLELEVIKKLYQAEVQQLSIDAVDQYVKVNVDQFHGIEIEEWPAQIAQVAMWLMDHQMNLLTGEAFGQTLVRLPLKKAANIVHGNALQIDWSDVLPAERCNFVFGNPPFIGSKYMTDDQRIDASKVFDGINSGGILDYVAAWYIKTSRYVTDAVRSAFVSTNSICQGEQVSVLWGHMLSEGFSIDFAHRAFQWSNEAKGVATVHCVIIGFSKHGKSKKRIFEYSGSSSEPTELGAKQINPYLVDAPNVLLPNRSKPICNVPKIKIGNKPIDGGHYLFMPEEKKEFIDKEPAAKKFFRPWLGSKEFLHNQERWCLWLGDCSPSELSKMPECKKRVDAVRESRKASKSKPTQKIAGTPTRFHVENFPQGNYLVVPKVSSHKRPFIPIGFLGPNTISSDLVFIAPESTLFEFGIMTSTMHMSWTRSVCGRLGNGYRYSIGIVYNNFPWPVDATDKQREAVSNAAQGVLDARASFPDSTLADLYDPSTMPPALVKAHQALDKAVDAAYVPSGGKKRWDTEAERVAFLFDLYQKITSN